ncbi:MBL fold metallo-hydrolase [Wenyingzhuangia sp. IMCC45533]
MTLYPIESGNFKLDGGAMFGVVPKAIWQKTNPADATNKIDIGMRCLLIEDGERLILIDTGLGNKQSDKFFSHFGPWGDFSLDISMAKYGFHRDDITDVFLTHLHFDHVGGAIQWSKDRAYLEPAFKNAVFWSNANHWQWATEPNPREKASFLSENINPIKDSGQLKFVAITGDKQTKTSELGFGIFYADGHTEKQMIPIIKYKGQTVVFIADLLPTVGHIPLPYVMSFDVRPLQTMSEKELFLNEAVENEYLLFMQHDANHEICTVQHTEKGVRLKETYTFKEIFNQ